MTKFAAPSLVFGGHVRKNIIRKWPMNFTQKLYRKMTNEFSQDVDNCIFFNFFFKLFFFDTIDTKNEYSNIKWLQYMLSVITVFPLLFIYVLLSVTSHINCIVARCLINVVYLRVCAFIRSWWHCTFLMMSLMRLNQQKIENYVIITSLKSETIGKLINRIPGSRLLISSLPGSALRTLVESLRKSWDVNKRSRSLGW